MQIRQYECHCFEDANGVYAEMKEAKHGSWANMEDVTALLTERQAFLEDSQIIDWIEKDPINRLQYLGFLLWEKRDVFQTIRQAATYAIQERKCEFNIQP